MALIKVDPSQTKTVIALLGVLVVALGVTVVRLKPNTAARPAQQQVAESVRSVSMPRVTTERTWDTCRNPFEKPPGFAAGSKAGDNLLASPSVSEESNLPLLLVKKEGEELGVNTPYSPLSKVGSLTHPVFTKDGLRQADQSTSFESGRAPKAPMESSPHLGPAPARPRFTLLATVNIGRAFSAVIRVGDSDERIVQVGDVLEGGFRVIALNADRAILTDGREIVVANRPR
ncbi:MAG: hypothetical protein N3B12_02775 [Armatimonadetes bacterium]|nr:hypothetical protein [Armatimonadota bacterium]